MNKTIILRYILWIATRLLTAAKYALFARFLDPESIGVWMAALAVATVSASTSNLGIKENLLRKQISAKPIAGVALTVELIAAFLSTLLGLFFIIPICIFFLKIEISPLLLAGLFYLNFSNVISFPLIDVEARGKLHYVQLPQFVSEATAIVFTVLAYFIFHTHLVALYSGGVAGFLSSCLCALIIGNNFPKPIIRFKAVKSFFLYGLPVAGYFVIASLATGAITVLLKIFHGAEAAAHFGYVCVVVNLIYGALSVLESSYYPAFARAAGNATKLKVLLEESSLAFAVIGCSLGGFMVLSAHDIVSLFFGDKWLSIVPLIEISGFQVTLRVSTVYLYGHLAYVNNYTRFMIRWALQDLLLVLTCGIFLIYNFAEKGAVIYQIVQGIIMIPLVRLPIINIITGNLKVFNIIKIPVLVWLFLLLIFYVYGSFVGVLIGFLFVISYLILVFALDSNSRSLLLKYFVNAF